MTPEKPRRLGRGLEALLTTSSAGQTAIRAEAGATQRIPITQIRPNPYQPRREFRPEELADLEASLRTSGLLQPITVRSAKGGSGYELIAGERRLRAATKLGWNEITAIIREVDDRTLLTLAMVENLQRADLNPVEEAEGYQRLVDEFGLSQQEVSDIVGKDRSTVSNSLRLLQLPAPVLALLQQGRISAGHGRALLGLSDDRRAADLANEIVENGLSVREVERRVRETPTPAGSSGNRTAAPSSSAAVPELRRMEDQLRAHLQTDVQIALTGKEKGSLRLSFYSADDLERLLDLILGPSREPL